MSNLRRYRDRNTGLIESYPESVARTFTFLEEVSEDAKPLAYVPISADVKADYLASRKGTKPEEDKTK